MVQPVKIMKLRQKSEPQILRRRKEGKCVLGTTWLRKEQHSCCSCLGSGRTLPGNSTIPTHVSPAPPAMSPILNSQPLTAPCPSPADNPLSSWPTLPRWPLRPGATTVANSCGFSLFPINEPPLFAFPEK